MKIALAVILPTLLVAYLAAWRVSEPWYDRRAMHPAARGMLWAGLALSAVGFGVVLLWLEILLFHLGEIPGWGARVYAPAIETVAILDVLAFAVTGVNHWVVLARRGWDPHRSRKGLGDAAGDLVEGVGDAFPARPSGGGSGLADLAPSGGGGGGWPSFGIDLDLGDEAGILVVGIGLFLLAAFLVAISLVGGGFVTYWVLRLHAND